MSERFYLKLKDFCFKNATNTRIKLLTKAHNGAENRERKAWHPVFTEPLPLNRVGSLCGLYPAL